ncbi:MAG: cbb3-type cytochrome c oxidase subunit I [Candidatus Thiosymbion ectosymbiont of Robbea hypermnestra]|nr:cbb3-type cytochrome c oxidase subunit I [Candidatus Thiosymbion ectosymbiont of Robbea hypermnestra]
MTTRDMMADSGGHLNATADQRWLATAWMMFGTIALALAGVFAILLVVARVPGTQALFPTQDFFRVALVVHVDQSVLIWFLAISGMLWSLAGRVPLQTARIAFVIAAAGCLLVAAAPFLGAGAPLLNNYVPVLDHPWFLVALGLFGIGMLVQVVLSLARPAGSLNFGDPLKIGALTAAAAALLAGVSLLWTWANLNPAWEGKAYYEYLFWGPGHILQFAYTQIMLVAWIWLARATDRPLPLSDTWLSALLVLGVLPLLAVPLLHGLYAPDSAELRIAYTKLMQYGNALAPVSIGLLLTLSLIRNRGRKVSPQQRPVYSALMTSLVLFAAGGLIGMAITGVNTIIPAHYHGSIVGVTLALMGLTYHLLPELGFSRPEGRMACWQARIYGTGQLLHIAGLAISGAMGIQRKTAGAAQELDGLAKAFMGLMGLGGLVAIVGGILFVLVVMRACSHRPA